MAVRKRRSTDLKQSPKGLIESRRIDVARGEHGFKVTETAPGTFVLGAPASLDMVHSMRDALREVARDAIAAQGLDPDHWRQIRRESDGADRACIAAMLLVRLDSMDRHLTALDHSNDVESARLGAHAAVKEALSAAWLFNTLSIVVHEVGIVAMEQSRAGASRGDTKRTENFTERDKKLAAEYLAKRATSRKSRTALMEEIGATHGLSRSAAVRAITKGLKKLSY